MSNPELSSKSSEAARRLGQTIRRLHKRLSGRVMTDMQDELHAHELSFSQITALHQLRAQTGMSVTQLAEGTHLSLPAASQLIERLVQRGLAARQENPHNRREKLVALTAAGDTLLARLDEAFSQAYVQMFAQTPTAPVQAAQTALQTLLDLLDQQEER